MLYFITFAGSVNMANIKLPSSSELARGQVLTKGNILMCCHRSQSLSRTRTGLNFGASADSEFYSVAVF